MNNLDRNIVNAAIENQDLGTLKQLMCNQNYIKLLDWPEARYEEDENPEDPEEPLLKKAIELGNVKIVDLLITAGAKLPRWNICLNMGLELAIHLGNEEIVQILLNAGANVHGIITPPIENAIYGWVEPPIVCATAEGNFELIKLLIEAGANINSQTEGGITPLMIAGCNGNTALVKFLVEMGADVNIVDSEGTETALYKAACYGYEEIFNYLMPLTTSLEIRELAKACFFRRYLLKEKKEGKKTKAKLPPVNDR